jgi:hypothetical protein
MIDNNHDDTHLMIIMNQQQKINLLVEKKDFLEIIQVCVSV